MPALISMFRGLNLGSHRRIKMDDLRSVYESLKFRDVRTYVQSGNVVCATDERDLERLAARIERAFEKKFGFQSDVALRTTRDLRQVMAKNPFAKRDGIEPAKLVVTFLTADPGDAARARVRAIPVGPEELFVQGRELYVYFPNGQGRSKLPTAAIERALGVSGTARNWNSVTALLEMAEALEGA